MLCVVIKGPSFVQAHQQITQALIDADLVELRLDGFTSIDIDALKQLRAAFSIPMIFTLRSQSQGGEYKHSEEDRLNTVRQLAALNPEYIDLEVGVPSDFLAEIAKEYPKIKRILSYHNFQKTPNDLEHIYQEMRKTQAHFYKIAVMANSSIDALRLLSWAKSQDNALIAVSMGIYGQISRIIAPVIGRPITYATLDDTQQTAPGQLSAKALVERYRYRSLSLQTELYGLIGDPVDRSISDETHNDFMGVLEMDAVYVKMEVRAAELPEFLSLAKTLSFKGLSVTMPLKEAILPFLDHVDPQAAIIGAVNTLVFRQGKINGFNTDGIGALDAIERYFSVKGRRIVVIGAGGAAKAIIYEAHQRGAVVTILNRSPGKAHQIACRLGGIGQGLEMMGQCAKAGYDLVINTTPVALPTVVENFLSTSCVMDIQTKPKETDFLRAASQKGCPVIHGYEMFVEQALYQFSLWLGERQHVMNYRSRLENKVVERVEL